MGGKTLSVAGGGEQGSNVVFEIGAICKQPDGGNPGGALEERLMEVFKLDAADGQHWQAHRAANFSEAIEPQRRAINELGRSFINGATDDEISAAGFGRSGFGQGMRRSSDQQARRPEPVKEDARFSHW